MPNDEDEIVIPSVEEMLANPVPSTSRGVQNRPKKKLKTLLPSLERMRMGSLLVYGKKLFTQGADIDALIEQTTNELANRRSAREMLETQEIENEVGAQRLLGAQKEISKQIANLVDRLKYLNSRKSRLLETLEAQQDRRDEFVNVGLDKTSFTSTPTQRCPPTGVLPDPVQFWHGLDDQEENAPETEPEASHYSSNLSEEGICAPGDCRCADRKCEDFNYTDQKHLTKKKL